MANAAKHELDPSVAQVFDPTMVVPNPATDLLPGESRLDTIWDSYYGEVEAGTPPLPYLAVSPTVDLDAVEAAVADARIILDGEKQTRIEVLTGKRFQQKTAEPRSKEETDRIKKARDEREKNAEIERKARGDRGDDDEDDKERKRRGEPTHPIVTPPVAQPKR